MIARIFRRLVCRLRSDDRGNVMMIVGLSLIPMTSAIGMAIDYSRAMRLQTELETVTDAASLSALTLPMMKKNIVQACATARHSFVSQIGGFEGMVLDVNDPAQFSVSITDSYPDQPDATRACSSADGSNAATGIPAPLARVVNVTFRGQSTNLFARMLGLSSLTVRGGARTETTLAPYVDIHLALDTSQSMGLAATPEGERQLYEATLAANHHGCQFGCHVPTGGAAISNEAIANNLNIKMRVDIERDAAIEMVSTARTNQGAQSLYRFGVYRIGRETTDIRAMTSDLAAVHTAVSGVKLGDNDASGYGDTNLTHLFDSMSSKITTHGNGTTQAQARAFLFIVTDGVEDLCGSSHCMGVVNPTRCQTYKDNNITVGVIYTTYHPVRADPRNPNNTATHPDYNWTVAPLPPSRIAPALRNCASPGWFFEATDADGIHTAMQKLFNQATQTPAIVR